MAPALKEAGGHVRVHPLLHWSEVDVWSYVQLEDLPAVSLYFTENGYRYRSLGCVPATEPVASQAANIEQIIEEIEARPFEERQGRAQDKESPHRMERLRSLGYL